MSGGGGGKRALSPETIALISFGMGFHHQALHACRKQCEELHETEKRTEDPERLRAIALQRSIHELEATQHGTTLTNIGLSFGVFEALGYDVSVLHEIRESMGRGSLETPDPEAEGGPDDAPP